MDGLGLSGVRTYIQSGNIVFRAPRKPASALAADIAEAIDARFGVKPHTAVISAADFAACAAANPFPESEWELDGKALHLLFLDAAPPAVDRQRLDAVKRGSERWALIGAVFYLHAPQGFGTSKLAAQAEKILGVRATARNWRTVGALLKMVEEGESRK
jgi:uncharacterized protein (DUF1697 family)